MECYLDFLSNLIGKMLIVMFGMCDLCFEYFVILICVYFEEGVMGLVVNWFLFEIGFLEFLDQFGIESSFVVIDIFVCFGGLVELGCGFVLYCFDVDIVDDDSCMMIGGDLVMFMICDILEDYVNGCGLQFVVLVFGYVGWGLGQLDDEILDNGWLIIDVFDDIIFGCDDFGKWSVVLCGMGVDLVVLLFNVGYV